MARYVIKPANLDVLKLEDIRNQWPSITDVTIKRKIAEEEQYLLFQKRLLVQLQFFKKADPPKKYTPSPIDLSLRAGIIKSIILLSASISEAALRFLGEAKGIDFKDRHKNIVPQDQRTFGVIIWSWINSGYLSEIKSIKDELLELNGMRNNIHLFRAAKDPKAEFSSILKEEENMLDKIDAIIDHLKRLS